MHFSNSILLAHLHTNRIAHTYLFAGTESPAKIELVSAFAKALNCESQRAFELCDCLSCRKIENRHHPDVHWIGEDARARSVKIETVRTLLHEASLRPFEGRWKVFILQGAERLTLEAAHALLKTLEEPPEHSVFLLLVENKAHLLATLQSRAFEIRTPPVPAKDPKEDPAIQALIQEGKNAFFAKLREADRSELQESLESLLSYLRCQSAVEWEKNAGKSKRFLKAFDSVYETQEALAANVNPKLALTHLEIQLEKTLQ